MKLLDMGLALLAAVLVLCHVAYTVHSQSNVLDGVYFSRGVVVMSNGDSYPIGVRIQAHDRQVHDFEQVCSQGQKFSFTLVKGLLGNARFVTSASSGSPLLDQFEATDRDIAFNYAYFSSLMSALTFYRLDIEGKNPCFYIRELERVMCFGMERSKSI